MTRYSFGDALPAYCIYNSLHFAFGVSIICWCFLGFGVCGVWDEENLPGTVAGAGEPAKETKIWLSMAHGSSK